MVDLGELGWADGHASPAKRPRTDTSKFLQSWAWKREHRPDKERFHRPYIHKLHVTTPADDCPHQDVQLTISQSKFVAHGFASTIWDSSIVVAKYLEKWQGKYRRKKCLDLSAGCGLIGIVLARLGATVTATDLAPNLPLLNRNCNFNGAAQVRVLEHTWGGDVQDLQPPFDLVVACDVMYVEDALDDLIKTLVAVSAPSTEVIVAHGRNRFAEASFMKKVQGVFDMCEVEEDQLDEVFQCSDVTVYVLRAVQA